MKLLIVTQKVDIHDPVLGFFHKWIELFAASYEEVTVVCLMKGEYHLPSHVRVYSLGKEKKVSKLSYVTSFYRFIFSERNKYDHVFVHMNEEYMILGGLLWKWWGKRVGFWRNHRQGSWATRISCAFADTLFYTSPESFTACYPHAIQMPIGIDISSFEDLSVKRIPRSVLMLGRISPVKRIGLAIDAFIKMKEKHIDFTVTIVGDPATKSDVEYFNELKEKVRTRELSQVIFSPGVPHDKTGMYYASHEVYMNLTPSGSFDKTIFEAMASGALVAMTNEGLKKEMSASLHEKTVCLSDASVIADKLEALIGLDEKTRDVYTKEMHHIAASNSVELLIPRIIDSYEKKH